MLSQEEKVGGRCSSGGEMRGGEGEIERRDRVQDGKATIMS